MTSTIAIIGAGNMGSALLGGLIASGLPANKLWMSDPSQEKLARLHQRFNINTTQQNSEAIKNVDVVLLAVKPQIITLVARELATQIRSSLPLVISIAAGVRESSLQQHLGGKIPIVRCMPNTPALIGCGATALYANSYVSDAQCNLAESIARAIGVAVWVKEEKLLDVVTALSGSGPAYFFLMMESLQNAAEKMGLPSDTARLLTLQTALGSARMALESSESLPSLRKRVTSPGGTTEKALQVLEEAELRELFLQVIQAATKRAEELAESSN